MLSTLQKNKDLEASFQRSRKLKQLLTLVIRKRHEGIDWLLSFSLSH